MALLEMRSLQELDGPEPSDDLFAARTN